MFWWQAVFKHTISGTRQKAIRYLWNEWKLKSRGNDWVTGQTALGPLTAESLGQSSHPDWHLDPSGCCWLLGWNKILYTWDSGLILCMIYDIFLWVWYGCFCLHYTCVPHVRGTQGSQKEGRVLDLLGQELQLTVSWDPWKRSPLSPSLQPPRHIFKGIVTTSPSCWLPCLEMKFQLDEHLQQYHLINRNFYSKACSVTRRLLQMKPKPLLDWHVLSVPNF